VLTPPLFSIPEHYFLDLCRILLPSRAHRNRRIELPYYVDSHDPACQYHRHATRYGYLLCPSLACFVPKSSLILPITAPAMDIQPKYLFPTLFGVLFISRLLWRTLASYLRLRAYPGPFIASLTDFWLLNTFWRNRPWRNTSKELHNKYGPIVRYGPNRLMFSSPSSIPVILSTSNVFEKVGRSKRANVDL
jgi:hypothetical protein